MAKEKNGTTGQANKTTTNQSNQRTISTHRVETLDSWDKYVSPAGAVAMTVYLVIFTILLLYAILQFWPSMPPANAARQVKFICWQISISTDLRLLAVVVFAGALGARFMLCVRLHRMSATES